MELLSIVMWNWNIAKCNIAMKCWCKWAMASIKMINRKYVWHLVEALKCLTIYNGIFQGAMSSASCEWHCKLKIKLKLMVFACQMLRFKNNFIK